MKLTKDSKIIFTGDSVTDDGRARPVGEGIYYNLGKGYVHDAVLSRKQQTRSHAKNDGRICGYMQKSRGVEKPSRDRSASRFREIS